MCGRSVMPKNRELVAKAIAAEASGSGTFQHFARPGRQVLTIADLGNGLTFPAMQWGFGVPTGEFYNARIENAKNGLWAPCWASRRAVMPLELFWEGSGAFTAPDRSVLFAAALWDHVGDQLVVSMVTQPANEIVAKYHHRMPALLHPDNVRAFIEAKEETNTHELVDPNVTLKCLNTPARAA